MLALSTAAFLFRKFEINVVARGEPQRKGVFADGYVVFRPHNEDGSRRFRMLAKCCEMLMRWADPAFSYTAVAVTKNFRGSPHIDTHDVTHQYACSFGTWVGGGGELCIEDAQHPCELIHVVNTRNRMVKVDGRYTHWVRACGQQHLYCQDASANDRDRSTDAPTAKAAATVFGSVDEEVDDGPKQAAEGDRFSLVFYSTEAKHATDRNCSLYSKWVPAGSDDATCNQSVSAR